MKRERIVCSESDLVALVPYQLGFVLLRTNDGVTMRPWACPVGREGGLRVV